MEYGTTRVPEPDLLEEDVAFLWSRHSAQVSVETPSFKNADSWELRSNGYVGYIPISDRIALRLIPKVPLRTLFGMLECAYRIDVDWLKGAFDAGSLDEFYGLLAAILAKRVLDRARRGLYREYVGESEHLSTVRGTIDLRDLIRQPWTTALLCHYEEHSADVIENQILAWTLFGVGKNGLCPDYVRPIVRRAFHTIQGATTLRQFQARDCVKRDYNRLNGDYRPMLALSRFFLDHSGPAHTVGEREMLPFIVDMNRLFEEFVAAWLRAHLSPRFELRPQERLRLGERGDVEFSIDLLIRDSQTGRGLLVLDTKYKAPDAPASADIEQIVAYAEATGCRAAALVFPSTATRGFRARVGDIWVHNLVFDLSRPLEDAGRDFLNEVAARCELAGFVE
jgi:5-methylcytosine-specific restriction enzyme subunit McrC